MDPFEKQLDDMQATVDMFSNLDTIGRRLALIELMEKGKIDFPHLAELYVEKLQKERNEKNGKIATLNLHLAIYCMFDNRPDGKQARKLIYESGVVDTSKWGDELEKEFGPKNNLNK